MGLIFSYCWPKSNGTSDFVDVTGVSPYSESDEGENKEERRLSKTADVVRKFRIRPRRRRTNIPVSPSMAAESGNENFSTPTLHHLRKGKHTIKETRNSLNQMKEH